MLVGLVHSVTLWCDSSASLVCPSHYLGRESNRKNRLQTYYNFRELILFHQWLNQRESRAGEIKGLV